METRGEERARAPLVVHPRRFHGSILSLLGRSRQEIVRVQGTPDFEFEADGTGRFGWCETGRQDGQVVPLYLMARVHDGVVHAVGIRSDHLLFLVDDEGEEPHLFTTPKDPEHDRRMLNWIVKRDGRYVNAGVDH